MGHPSIFIPTQTHLHTLGLPVPPQISGKLSWINPPVPKLSSLFISGNGSQTASGFRRSKTSACWPFCTGYPVTTNNLPTCKICIMGVNHVNVTFNYSNRYLDWLLIGEYSHSFWPVKNNSFSSISEQVLNNKQSLDTKL